MHQQVPFFSLSSVCTISIDLVRFIDFLFSCVPSAAKSLQSCPTLCDPTDGSPPGSPVSGILQARTLEWVALSSSNAWQWKVKVKSPSRVRLLATPWTAAYQAPPSMGFSRHEYYSISKPVFFVCLFFLIFGFSVFRIFMFFYFCQFMNYLMYFNRFFKISI